MGHKPPLHHAAAHGEGLLTELGGEVGTYAQNITEYRT
jgi:hypothetical protein